MPLLEGEQFHRRQPPCDLDSSEELFFSPITLEVFRDYDEYFERTILVNSTIWHCSVCGRGPLTFTDAMSCEATDRRDLRAFNPALSAGLLYIIHHSKLQRLFELVELLCGFASGRFFIGEPIVYSAPNSKERSDYVIRRVMLASHSENRLIKKSTSSEGYERIDTVCGSVSGADYVYQLGDASSDQESSLPFASPGIFLQHNCLHRPAKTVVNKDRIRFFIRNTCELRNGCFMPKVTIMQQFQVHPHGSLTWADLFPPPEPDWTKLARSILVRLSAQRVPVGPSHLSGPVSVQQSRRAFRSPVCQRSTHKSAMLRKSNSSLNSSVADSPTAIHVHKQSPTDIPKCRTTECSSVKPEPPSEPNPPRIAERVERLELEREWCAVRRREDLELPDLIPLPDFPKFSSRIAPDDLGTAFQLFEFFQVFSQQLNLFVPHDRLPSNRSRLGVQSGCSFSWAELELALVDSDPGGPLADLFLSLLCAIRRFEMDASNRQIPPSVLAATHAAATAVAAAEVGSNFTSYAYGHLSDYGPLFEELTMGSKRSTMFRVLQEAAAATRFNELVGIPSAAASQAAGKAAVSVVSADDPTDTGPKDDLSQASLTRNFNIRAAATAALAGAASLCPLDRAGLTTALWLHIVGAAARFSSWRVQLRGASRPLDDPAMMFSREHPTLLKKMTSVSVYDLDVHEKLLLLTCLMDQVLLHAPMRDFYESNFDRQRLLRTQLRNLHFDRSLVNPPVSDLVVDGQSTKSKPSGPAEVPATPNKQPSKSNRTVATVGIGVTSRSREKATEQVPAEKAESPSDSNPGSVSTICDDTLPPVKSDSELAYSIEDCLSEKQNLWYAILNTSRGCSMMSLGQDRFCRRYWLLLSFPAIVIEDAPCHLDAFFQRPSIINRQMSSFYPELAERMGITSAAAAAQRIRDLSNCLSDRDKLDRACVTYKLASRLPKNMDSSAVAIEPLRLLVKPTRPTLDELANHRNSAVHIQCARLMFDRYGGSRSVRSSWHVIDPLNDPIPDLNVAKADASSSGSSTTPVSLNTQSKSEHRLLAQCESETTEKTNVSQSEFASDLTTQPNKSPNQSSSNGVDETVSDLTSREYTPIERAAWTIDCLESALNPRGIREARLRKTIGQIRPLLIDIVASRSKPPFAVPPSFEHHNYENKDPCTLVPPPTTTESTRHSSQSTLLSWLEITIRRMAARLGLSRTVRSVLAPNGVSVISPSSPCPSPNRGSANLSPTALLTETFDSHARLGRLSQALLIIANVVGSKRVTGPISNENKTLRFVPSVSVSSLTSDHCVLPSVTNTEQTPNQFTSRLTGWQRWCSSVSSSTSSSELHLLARALERGIRMASMTGRSCTSSTGGKVSLPKLRCTACREPPDPHLPNSVTSPTPLFPHPPVNSTRGPYVPFSVCAGCCAPFHLDCLLNSRSRVRLTSLRQSHKPRSPESVADVDCRMTGYCSLHSPLSSVTAARMETICSASYLCNACLRVTAPRDLSDSTSLRSDSPNQLTGDEDWHSDSDDIEEAKVTGKFSRTHGPQVRKRRRLSVTTQPPCPRRFKSKMRFSEDDDESSISRHSDCTSPSISSNRQSSPAQQSRSRRRISTCRRPNRGSRDGSSSTTESGSGNDARHRSFRSKQLKPVSTLGALSDADDENCLHQAATGINAGSVTMIGTDFRSDDIEHLKFSNGSCLKHASVVLSPCDTSVDVLGTTVSKRPVGRPRRISVLNAAPLTMAEDKTSGCTQHVSPNSFDFSQSSVERLFSEICNSKSARPLLRCGLGRTIAMAELVDNHVEASLTMDIHSEDRNDSRRSSRVRYPNHRLNDGTSMEHSESRKLFAWDLSGLQDLLIRKSLPGGPRQAVSQLRLLIAHWLQTNRLGSRLHQCALDVSHQLESKLSQTKLAN